MSESALTRDEAGVTVDLDCVLTYGDDDDNDDDYESFFHEELVLIFPRRMRLQPFVCLFSKLSSVAANMGNFSDALLLFDEMRGINVCTMNIVTNCSGVAVLCSLIIGSCVTIAVTEELLFQKLLVLKLCESNEVMDCIVIDGLCVGGCFEAATLQKSINAFCKEKRLKDLIYPYIWRNLSSINLLIDGYCLR